MGVKARHAAATSPAVRPHAERTPRYRTSTDNVPATAWGARIDSWEKPNTFALKTIFGWVTDKELNRYTRDFDREAEAVGMLIKLNERRKAG